MEAAARRPESWTCGGRIAGSQGTEGIATTLASSAFSAFSEDIWRLVADHLDEPWISSVPLASFGQRPGGNSHNWISLAGMIIVPDESNAVPLELQNNWVHYESSYGTATYASRQHGSSGYCRLFSLRLVLNGQCTYKYNQI